MFQVSVYDGVPLYLTAIVEIGAKQDLQQRIMVDIISLRGPVTQLRGSSTLPLV